jgi:hypothetical protein
MRNDAKNPKRNEAKLCDNRAKWILFRLGKRNNEDTTWAHPSLEIYRAEQTDAHCAVEISSNHLILLYSVATLLYIQYWNTTVNTDKLPLKIMYFQKTYIYIYKHENIIDILLYAAVVHILHKLCALDSLCCSGACSIFLHVFLEMKYSSSGPFFQQKYFTKSMYLFITYIFLCSHLFYKVGQFLLKYIFVRNGPFLDNLLFSSKD